MPCYILLHLWVKIDFFFFLPPKEELSHFIAITSIIFLPGELRPIQLWNSLSLYYAALVILCLTLLMDAQGGSISSRKRGWGVKCSTRTLQSEAGGKTQRYSSVLEKCGIQKNWKIIFENRLSVFQWSVGYFWGVNPRSLWNFPLCNWEFRDRVFYPLSRLNEKPRFYARSLPHYGDVRKDATVKDGWLK